MQHANRFFQPRCLDHSKRTGVIPHPDLFNAFADDRHGLEVVGLLAALQSVKLTTGVLPCVARKIAQVLE